MNALPTFESLSYQQESDGMFSIVFPDNQKIIGFISKQSAQDAAYIMFEPEEPEYWDGTAGMVPYTFIEWINGKAVKLFESWVEFDFNFDANPDWWDMPF